MIDKSMTDTSARSTGMQKCFSEAKINGLTLRNRIIKAGTFEGKTPTGLPTPELTELHRRIGQGGTAMTTIGIWRKNFPITPGTNSIGT